MFEGGDSFIKS